jgi:streptomycin 6-kinase
MMRLQAPDHGEMFALARRLERTDAGHVRDDRRALLLFWFGSGAARLHAEEDALLTAWERHGGRDHPLNAAIRAEHDRLSRAVADVAVEPRPSPDSIRRVGAALTTLLRVQDRELAAVVERALPARELAGVDQAMRRAHG